MSVAEVVTNQNNGQGLRDNLINTAVKFLTNPNVQRCTLESKERFLKAKGLTDAEIQQAFQKCLDSINFPSISSELMYLQGASRMTWVKDRIIPIVVYGGFIYGAYWFYKNFIKQFIFTERRRVKTTVECLDEIMKTLELLNTNICGLRSDFDNLSRNNSNSSALITQIDNIKTDVSSVKAILLNRNQFPTIKARVEPPSIPAWQRQNEEATSDPDTEKVESKVHRPRSQRSASGGSNSSEGEAATKNSDSSLEIIT